MSFDEIFDLILVAVGVCFYFYYIALLLLLLLVGTIMVCRYASLRFVSFLTRLVVSAVGLLRALFAAGKEGPLRHSIIYIAARGTRVNALEPAAVFCKGAI